MDDDRASDGDAADDQGNQDRKSIHLSFLRPLTHPHICAGKAPPPDPSGLVARRRLDHYPDAPSSGYVVVDARTITYTT